jgi:hypothetical protein
MLSTDREEFDAQVAILCAGSNVPVGDRAEAYWKGCGKMTLIEFARVVEFALSESGPDKIPTTKQCWMIRNELKRGPAQTQQALPIRPAPQWSYWHLRVDSLFFRYLARRRGIELFKGNINIGERREACRKLWEFFDDHEREFGREATIAEDLQGRFDQAMAAVEDISQDDAWLAAELHRQKLEDQAGTRR